MRRLFGWRSFVGLLVFTAFCVGLFPYERAREPLCEAISHALGVPFRVSSLRGVLDDGWPSLRAENWQLGAEGDEILDGPTLTVRPVLDPAWLLGSPSFIVDAALSAGHLSGTAEFGEARRFVGRLEGFRLTGEEIVRLLPSGPALLTGATGSLDADLDLVAASDLPGRWSGRIAFAIANGTLPVPEYPVSVPFESLSGLAELGPRGGVGLRDFELAGPQLAVRGHGQLAPGLAPQRAPLTGELEIRLRQPALAGVVESLGVEVDPAGLAFVRLSGTLDQPIWR